MFKHLARMKVSYIINEPSLYNIGTFIYFSTAHTLFLTREAFECVRFLMRRSPCTLKQ
jgi:hypothetical protein